MILFFLLFIGLVVSASRLRDVVPRTNITYYLGNKTFMWNETWTKYLFSEKIYGDVSEATGLPSDTNASTACSGGQVLLGNGSCAVNFDYNSSDEIFTIIDNSTFQYEIGSDCSAGDYVYGVSDAGVLSCRADQTGNTTNEIFGVCNNNTFQLEIGSDCSVGDFVKGVDDDGTLDCSTPSYIADTNASTICSSDQVLLGNETCLDLIGNEWITPSEISDVDLEDICNGDTCPFPRITGEDAMQGNFDMGNKNITEIHTLNTTDASGDNPICLINNGTHLIIEDC